MKGRGIVPELGKAPIGAGSAAANATPPPPTGPKPLRGGGRVPAMPNGLDGCLRAELLPQSPDAHVDHVGARVEVVPPDVREQALARHHLALVEDEVVQEPELAVRELCHQVAELRLPAREIERERPGVDDVAVLAVLSAPQLRANARDQLVERERLRP